MSKQLPSASIQRRERVDKSLEKIKEIIDLCSEFPAKDDLSEFVFQTAVLLKNGLCSMGQQLASENEGFKTPRISLSQDTEPEERKIRNEKQHREAIDSLLFTHRKVGEVLEVIGGELDEDKSRGNPSTPRRSLETSERKSRHGSLAALHSTKNYCHIKVVPSSGRLKEKIMIIDRHQLTICDSFHPNESIGRKTKARNETEIISLDLLDPNYTVQRITDGKSADLVISPTNESSIRIRIEDWSARDNIYEELMFYQYHKYVNSCLEGLSYKTRADVQKHLLEDNGYHSMLFERKPAFTSSKSRKQRGLLWSFMAIIKKKMTRSEQRIVISIQKDPNDRRMQFSRYSSEAGDFVVGKEFSVKSLRGFVFNQKSHDADIYFTIGEYLVHRCVHMRRRAEFIRFHNAFMQFQDHTWNRKYELVHSKLLARITRRQEILSSSSRQTAMNRSACVSPMNESKLHLSSEVEDGSDVLKSIVMNLAMCSMFNSCVSNLEKMVTKSAKSIERDREVLRQMFEYLFEAVGVYAPPVHTPRKTSSTAGVFSLSRSKSMIKMSAKGERKGGEAICRCDEGCCRLGIAKCLKYIRAVSPLSEIATTKSQDIEIRCWAIKCIWAIEAASTHKCVGKIKPLPDWQLYGFGKSNIRLHDIITKLIAKEVVVPKEVVHLLFEILLGDVSYREYSVLSEEFYAEFRNPEALPALMKALASTNRSIGAPLTQRLVVLLNNKVNRKVMLRNGGGVWQKWLAPLLSPATALHSMKLFLTPSASSTGSLNEEFLKVQDTVKTRHRRSSTRQSVASNNPALEIPSSLMDPKSARYAAGIFALLHKDIILQDKQKMTVVGRNIRMIALQIFRDFKKLDRLAGADSNALKIEDRNTTPPTSASPSPNPSNSQKDRVLKLRLMVAACRDMICSTMQAVMHDTKKLEKIKSKVIWSKIGQVVDITLNMFVVLYIPYCICAKRDIPIWEQWHADQDAKFLVQLLNVLNVKLKISKNEADSNRHEIIKSLRMAIENVPRTTDKLLTTLQKWNQLLASDVANKFSTSSKDKNVSLRVAYNKDVVKLPNSVLSRAATLPLRPERGLSAISPRNSRKKQSLMTKYQARSLKQSGVRSRPGSRPGSPRRRPLSLTRSGSFGSLPTMQPPTSPEMGHSFDFGFIDTGSDVPEHMNSGLPLVFVEASVKYMILCGRAASESKKTQKLKLRATITKEIKSPKKNMEGISELDVDSSNDSLVQRAHSDPSNSSDVTLSPRSSKLRRLSKHKRTKKDNYLTSYGFLNRTSGATSASQSPEQTPRGSII